MISHLHLDSFYPNFLRVRRGIASVEEIAKRHVGIIGSIKPHLSGYNKIFEFDCVENAHKARTVNDDLEELGFTSVYSLREHFHKVLLPQAMVGPPSMVLYYKTVFADLHGIKRKLSDLRRDACILVSHNKYRVSFSDPEDYILAKLSGGTVEVP